MRSRYRLWAVFPLLLSAAVSACGDSTRPQLRGATVRIYLDGTPYDEQTVKVESILQLVGNVLDSGGRIVEAEPVDWSSDRPDIASVDGQGFVTARSVGTARIVARHEVGADTALLKVAQRVSPEELAGCVNVGASNLQVGEIAVSSGDQEQPLCLPGGDTGAEYTMTVVNTGSNAASVLNLLIHARDLSASSDARSSRQVGPAGAKTSGRGLENQPASPNPFHERLRQDVSERLEARLRRGVRPAEFAAPQPALAIGSTLSFNVETSSEDGCTAQMKQVKGGRIRAISERAIVVADTLNPAGGFTGEDYRDFAAFFDQEVWPLVTENFGEPSDIDGNGRVVIFFTRAVNDLPANTGPDESTYTGGFFFNRDLFPASECAGSNEAEMFYLLVPNPNPGAGERSFTRDYVARNTRTVLVHEFQHLVNDSRRLHVNDASVWEDTWLNEGLSHVAEELMFYRISGLEPGENLGPAGLAAPGVREAFRLFQKDNFERLAVFLRGPEYVSMMGADLLGTRGATWSFLRYAADRRGGDEREIWHALVRDGQSAGVEALQSVFGGDTSTWIRDWAAAIYLDDAGFDMEPVHRFESWNLRGVYSAMGELYPGGISRPYPLRVSRLYAGENPVLPLKGGSPGYRRVEVQAGQVGAIYFLTGAYLPVPSRLKIVVVRSR